MNTRIVPGFQNNNVPAVHVGSYAVERRILDNHAKYSLNSEMQAKILYIISGTATLGKHRGFRAIYLPPGTTYQLENTTVSPIEYLIISRTRGDNHSFNCSLVEPSLLVRCGSEEDLFFDNVAICIRNAYHPELKKEVLPIKFADEEIEPHQKSEYIAHSIHTHQFILSGKGQLKSSTGNKIDVQANHYFTATPDNKWKLKNTGNTAMQYITIYDGPL
ncbi:MAG: hypothetical protein VX777_04815 [Chlamydiota bacterium]|nr:hypothetical protein [Chlamydiota bacterium]